VSGLFAQWQPRYAEHNIPTFPVSSAKRPAVRGYYRMGLPASKTLAGSWRDASAFGFVCGKRSGITSLDIDTTDERIWADALDRHGRTPVVARTGSGHAQAWYRHNGEGRRIRPLPGRPIDILEAGYVVAPPSHVEKGDYQFIQGGLDDIEALPVLQNVPAPIGWKDKREGDGRNEAMFRHLGRVAQRYADDFNQLLDYALTQNGQFAEPLPDAEVAKIAASIWRYQTTGQNRFGRYGAYVPLELVTQLAVTPDALALYNVLEARNGPRSVFPIANAMADTVIGYGWRRLANARKAIVALGLVEQVSPQTQHQPARYRWPSAQGHQSGE